MAADSACQGERTGEEGAASQASCATCYQAALGKASGVSCLVYRVGPLMLPCRATETVM